MSALENIIERLEKATGPDMRLDQDIHQVANPRDFNRIYSNCRAVAPKHEPEEIKDSYTRNLMKVPNYTSSIDAAMTLVPERWSYSIGENESRNNSQAALGRSYPTNKYIVQEAAAPAGALCIAALRAHSTIKTESGES